MGCWRAFGALVAGVYAIVLMASFNFFSHGSQDLYPPFSRRSEVFHPDPVARLPIVYNIGAICGGLLFGTLSSRMGRRRGIALAAGLSLVALPFWAYSLHRLRWLRPLSACNSWCRGPGASCLLHLNELSPEGISATFPASSISLGICSPRSICRFRRRLPEQAHGGLSCEPDYAFGMTLVMGIVAVVLVCVALLESGETWRAIRTPMR